MSQQIPSHKYVDCRFVILVIGTVVYGRGDEQHVEASKDQIHADHPHHRWQGTHATHMSFLISDPVK